LIERIIDRLRNAALDGAEIRVLRGIRVEVVNNRPDIETSAVLARLDAALSLIERFAPARLRHLGRDISRISVVAFPCRGAYLPAQHTIVTELSFLHRTGEFSDAQIASSIVHESVHARVHRTRERFRRDLNRFEIDRLEPPVRRDQGDDMAREERLCRRAELAFGESLPAELSEPVVRRAIESLRLGDREVAPEVNWSEAHAAKQRADQAAVDLWRSSGGGKGGGGRI
jgi:hypothetical protein